MAPIRIPRHGRQAPASAPDASPDAPLAAARRRRIPRWLAVLASLAGIVLLCWLLRAPILTGVARFLTVHDRLEKADAIFVFGGDPDVRPFAAAALYHRGWAPRVLVPGMETGKLSAMGLTPTQTQLFTGVLHREGVPDSAVSVLTIPGGTTSTTDDVAVLRAWLQRTHSRRVIAVTTDYHTRRARWALRRGLKGMDVRVMMYGTPAQGFDEANWWRTEGGLVTYFNEYLKFARYVFVRS
ncbi:MAG: YdcF family protein [Gemmatimonadetes bacterium]|nr:YdcF family protein [Gemmatimonadota bacterium]